MIVTALALFLFSKPLAEHFSKKLSQKKSALPVDINVGQVVEVIGVATVKRGFSAESVSLESVELPYQLHHQDRLTVMSGSLVRFLTIAGAEVLLTENSEAFVEFFNAQDSLSPIYVFMRRGSLELKNTGARNRLFIVKDRKVINAQDWAKEALKPASSASSRVIDGTKIVQNKVVAQKSQPEITDSNQNEPPDEADILIVNGEETLSNQYVEKRLASQYQALRRCQINSLRDRENALGLKTYSLKIEPTGQISQVRSLETNSTTPLLNKCVQEVLVRTSLKKFRGQPFILNYPIDFQ